MAKDTRVNRHRPTHRSRYEQLTAEAREHRARGGWTITRDRREESLSLSVLVALSKAGPS
jgi:hypothetical protein